VIFVLAIAANLDNLGVGIAYGMARNRISRLANALIALLAIVLTLIAMLFGQWLQHVVLPRMADVIGALMILGIGIWIYGESTAHFSLASIQKRLRQLLAQPATKSFPQLTASWEACEPEEVISSQPGIRPLQQHQSGVINLQETLILGISLSLNAIAGGFGASLNGENPILTSIAIGLFSYLTIDIGQLIAGKYFSRWLGSFSQKMAGLLLIGLGTYELIT
jgi:putative sporulation protein YtaF